jgi:hypothetical protein
VIHPRADLMVDRVARALDDTPFPEPDRARLEDLARRVMAARSDRFADEHHPALLHPLRAVLLLLETDAPDARSCEAALVLDRDSAEARPDAGAPPEIEAPPEVEDLLRAEEDERLEALLAGPEWLLRAWLAVRLDHLRHLHMWAGVERTEREVSAASELDGPLAARVGGRLDRAWADWLGKAARYRLAARADRWSPDELRAR